MSPETRWRRRPALRRDELFDAAQDLLAERELAQVAVEEITQAAGVRHHRRNKCRRDCLQGPSRRARLIVNAIDQTVAHDLIYATGRARLGRRRIIAASQKMVRGTLAP